MKVEHLFSTNAIFNSFSSISLRVKNIWIGGMRKICIADEIIECLQF